MRHLKAFVKPWIKFVQLFYHCWPQTQSQMNTNIAYTDFKQKKSQFSINMDKYSVS